MSEERLVMIMMLVRVLVAQWSLEVTGCLVLAFPLNASSLAKSCLEAVVGGAVEDVVYACKGSGVVRAHCLPQPGRESRMCCDHPGLMEGKSSPPSNLKGKAL